MTLYLSSVSEKLNFSQAFTLLALLSAILLNACAPAKSTRPYADLPTTYEIIPDQGFSGVESLSVTVDANRVWQNSRLLLQPGDRVRIIATGRWSAAPAWNWWSGPEGNPAWNDIYYEVSWITTNALMAKIGNNGKPFEIGELQPFTAKQGGYLFLSINDNYDWLGDNQGAVTAKIEHKTVIGAPTTTGGSPQTIQKQQLTNQSQNTNSSNNARVALIIGNSDYINAPLPNPKNDATDMANKLKSFGFSVQLLINAEQRGIEEAIQDFGYRLIRTNGVGLFYYAGHGVQLDGRNYMIPLNAGIKTQKDVRYKAVDVGQVLDEMGTARNGLNIVLLDACRDNPLPRSFRSGSRGLGQMEGPKGTIIGFATSPGSVAEDGLGRNGVYTKHILQNLDKPGLSVEQVFKGVLRGVNKETAGRQVPWLSSSFVGDFVFNPQ